MSVIVKGMEMPKCCSDCYLCKNFKCIPLDIDLLGHCPITYWGGRLDNCPLTELPPHGRLIDAEKIDFRNDAMHDGTGNLVVADNFINGILWLNDCIDRTPTVIEAEGSET